MDDLADIDLTDPDTFAAGPPHDAFRRLRDHAPVHWHEPTPATPDGEGASGRSSAAQRSASGRSAIAW